MALVSEHAAAVAARVDEFVRARIVAEYERLQLLASKSNLSFYSEPVAAAFGGAQVEVLHDDADEVAEG